MAVLKESRVTISLVPDRFVAEALREEGISVDDLEPRQDGDTIVLGRTAVAERLFSDAIARWLGTIRLWKRIGFTMQQQLQTQWCWAATSVSVSKYYRPSSSWTQCSMVNAERGQTTCCVNGSSSQCNQPNVLDSPLSRAKVLDHMQGGDVSYDVIQDEIDAGRPLCWRIGWSGGGGHFAVIEGYRIGGTPWVTVDDPIYGQSDVALSTITGGQYQGSGDWTHTYFTRRPPLIRFDHLKDLRLPVDVLQQIRRVERQPVAGGERS